MLVFDHLNSSLPAIFDDLFKPFKEQHSHNTRGARRYILNIPKMKTSFYGSRSVQVKSIKDWNNIIVNWQTDKIHFTPEDFIFMKCFEVIKKIKKYTSGDDKTTLITILDNLSYYLPAFILPLSKTQPLPALLNNKNILPFLSLWFSFVCLPLIV